jgi:very-short-patch-repair endonuclease
MGTEPRGSADEPAVALPWHIFGALKGQTLETLVHSREFTILDVSPYAVRLLRKETGRTAYVERLEFQRALAALWDKGTLSIGDIRELSPRGSSYVAALLTKLSGVAWDKDRGHLCLARAGEGPRSGSDPRGPARPREQPDRPSFDAVWAEQSDDVLDYWRKLNSRTQKDIISLTLADSAMVVRTIGSCESVLEQVLAAHLLTVARMMSLVQDFTLEPQHEVETPAGQFRIDLLARGLVNGCLLCLAVECDGHAYHDRTKEQAARDRQRDCALKLAGYEVVRFAGSEILDDPEECALEVFRQMLALARRAPGTAGS